jgi:hypothetical protein
LRARDERPMLLSHLFKPAKFKESLNGKTVESCSSVSRSQ